MLDCFGEALVAVTAVVRRPSDPAFHFGVAVGDVAIAGVAVVRLANESRRDGGRDFHGGTGRIFGNGAVGERGEFVLVV